jgi:epoxyqueuosine reductase
VKVGVCRPDAVPETAGRLRGFLAAGRHGQMGWMAEREGWRGSAAALWPEARSVVMLAEAYTPEGDPMAGLAQRDRGVVGLCAGQGLSRSGQAAAEAAGALD